MPKSCNTRLSIEKFACDLEVLIAINDVRTIEQSIHCDDCYVLK